MKKIIVAIILILLIVGLLVINNKITKNNYNRCLENNSKSICNDILL